VYPLTPCLHRPTFLANLAARLDKTDPVFFALTLTVLASTLVQVPRHLVNLEKAEIEALARRCVRVARAKIGHLWEVRLRSPMWAGLISRNHMWSRALSVSLPRSSCLYADSAVVISYLYVCLWVIAAILTS
jgi:hypothetical protein